MASIKISLPDPMHDYVQARIDRGQYASASEYVRDLISRDQGGVENEKRWLRDLDVSVSDTLAEMGAGGGVELDAACNAALADIDGLARSSRA
ncbi:antitoxin ParD1/3/4 [Sphingomonas sp. PP-CE-3G-477]|jgi:antitoxin ParD1/3/4|uniref:ribbon-helix-helix domain-containing protein n=1 Tax=Sphingomonas sp. PP-CE-3G-477 TaxID=2135660 RepID=UPI000D39BA5F|nr:type II toxin-antitoxin system ParD family antitoxin [Sphingomonas sp. PP-CE-3G-477]PTQ65501.1 antitoxin ParD1/3/4 [Sphingomonas sp. PP-CE-3G-477]